MFGILSNTTGMFIIINFTSGRKNLAGFLVAVRAFEKASYNFEDCFGYPKVYLLLKSFPLKNYVFQSHSHLQRKWMGEEGDH